MKNLEKMKGRSLLKLSDISDDEMLALLDLADALKREGDDRALRLQGRSIAMLFEKSSTRTRCATAVAMASEGGHAEYLSGMDIHLGKKESVADTARVLGRMFDGIMFRGFSQSTVEDLAEYAGVPVWNGLTDLCHPTQVLAGLMTVKEFFGRLKGLRFVYIGDGRNNVATSFMFGCAKAGLDCCICSPERLQPAADIIDEAEHLAGVNGCSITCESNHEAGVLGANVLYTDVWTSMGEEEEFQQRFELLKDYQVNMQMMKNTGNLESDNVIFMHCLPAYHDNKTETSKKTGALEVTGDVFEASFSLVFDEAENRMHTIKALILASLGKIEL